jgi:hypothetical protein
VVIEFGKNGFRRFGVGFSFSVMTMNPVVMYGVAAVIVGTVASNVYKDLIYGQGKDAGRVRWKRRKEKDN